MGDPCRGLNKSCLLESSFDIFRLVEEAFERYNAEALLPDFLLLMFLLNHLREWIVRGQKREEMTSLSSLSRTREQTFFLGLWNLREFRTINEICNGVKHHEIKSEISEMKGFRAGLSRAGDRLGQTYLFIDGKDSRDVFAKVIAKYRDFFRATKVMSEA
jgi:hypothetical protein